jgi:hypothetical protein
MKNYLLITLTLIFIVSCKKEEPEAAIPKKPKSSIVDDLKSVIQENKIEALVICSVGSDCDQSIGWGTDYSFIGDNFVRVQNWTYNLNNLVYYDIETVKVLSQTEKRLILNFPKE